VVPKKVVEGAILAGNDCLIKKSVGFGMNFSLPYVHDLERKEES
jgi:hypothetical protein